MRTLVPGYPGVVEALATRRGRPVVRRHARRAGALLAGACAGLDLFVLDAPHLYARPGDPYVGADGREWPDNALRFAALGAAAAAIGRGRIAAFVPDVVHAHDWQAGLAPAYLHYGGTPRPRTVMTVHNLAFQGQFPASLLRDPRPAAARAYALDGVEYYGTIGFLKAGLALADRITTVSPTYAAEIRTPEFGMGLDGLLRHRSAVLTGILNGIDTDRVESRAPIRICRPASTRSTSRGVPRTRRRCRRGMGLAIDPAAPLFGVVSRLTWQKGMDLLLDALPDAPRAGRAARRWSAPAKRRSRPASPPPPGTIRSGSRRASATTKRSRTSCRAAPTRW